MDRVFNQNVNSPKKNLLWLIPVIVVIIIIAAVVPVLMKRAEMREREATMAQTGKQIFQALSEGNIPNSLALLEKYREAAMPILPEETKDDLFRLDRKNFPLYTDTIDQHILQDILLFVGAVEGPAKSATNQRHLTINMLGYVMRSVQSGGGRPEAMSLVVPPALVLMRGYGNPVQAAWLYAKLLRYTGMHTAVIYLEQGEGVAPYAITGVAIEGKLLLFDPYRAMPLIRKSDGAIADLASIVSGKQELEQGFGGEGTPVTVEALKKALYFVPSEPENVLPDSYFINRILQEGGRKEIIYRPFRRDLRNMAAAVFGEGAKVEDKNVAFFSQGRAEIVAIWDRPFKLEAMFTDPKYIETINAAHMAEQILIIPRQAQILGNRELAIQEYEKIIATAGNADAVQDAAFFKAMATNGQKERIAGLVAFTEKYPESTRRPLALIVIAELQAMQNNKDEALRIAQTVPAPYDIRAKQLIKALEANQQGIVWKFPAAE